MTGIIGLVAVAVLAAPVLVALTRRQSRTLVYCPSLRIWVPVAQYRLEQKRRRQ